MNQKPGRLYSIVEWLSLPLLVLLWYAAALFFDHRLFPGPVAVTQEIVELALRGHLLDDISITLTRAALAFLVAMVLGTFLGAVLGRVRVLDRLFGNWVLIGLNVPAIVVAIACYIWLGLTEFALILAVVINKTPLVTVTMREGVRALDQNYFELARAYRVGFWRRLTRFLVPQLMPYFLTAARTGMSLIWKIVLVFEVLGSDGGVGFRIGVFFQNFDISGILAYTAVFLGIVFLFEYGFLQKIEGAFLGWRPAQQFR